MSSLIKQASCANFEFTMRTFVDPSPTFELDIMQRVQAQVSLIDQIQQVYSTLLDLSKQLKVLESSYKQSANADPSINSYLSSFSQVFSLQGQSQFEQSNMILTALKTVLVPEVNSLCQQYEQYLPEYNKALDDYMQLPPKTRPDILNEAQNHLLATTEKRASLLYALHTSLDKLERTAGPAIQVSLGTTLATITSQMVPFINEHSTSILASQESYSQKLGTLKYAFKSDDIDLSNNPAKQFANDFCNVRFWRGRSTAELSFPSSVLYYKQANKWTRVSANIVEGMLILADPSTGSADVCKPLALVQVTPIPFKDRSNTFKLQCPDDTLIFQAFSSFDITEWIARFNNHNMSVLAGPQAHIEDIQCADCGAMGASWVSINWGINLCINCSGVHRQLSTDQSKVRSVALDNINPSIKAFMKECGNETANSILLAKTPNMDVFPQMEESQRAIFINRKYKMREWAISDPVPSPFESIVKGNLRDIMYSMNFGRGSELDQGITPLHAAASCGNPKVAALVASASPNLDPLDPEGWTPLCYSIWAGDYKTSQLLLDMGCNPSVAEINLALLVYVMNGHRMKKNILPRIKWQEDDTTEFEPLVKKYFPPNIAKNGPVIALPQHVNQARKALSQEEQ